MDDFKSLRQEVLDLEKSDRDRQKEIEELKKKLDAKPAVEAKPQVKEGKSAGEAK